MRCLVGKELGVLEFFPTHSQPSQLSQLRREVLNYCPPHTTSHFTPDTALQPLTLPCSDLVAHVQLLQPKAKRAWNWSKELSQVLFYIQVVFW